MNRRDFVRSYLSFSRRERIAALVIGILILVVTFLPDWLSRSEETAKPSGQDSLWLAEARQLLRPDSQVLSPGQPRPLPEQDKAPGRPGLSFDPPASPVDPNTLDASGWQKLGLTARTARIIANYLSKGGRFRKPEDLRKIYSLQAADCDRLLPYLRFPDPPAGLQQKSWEAKENSPRQPPKPEILELNTADSAALESLPGIGPTLASRIIRFREKLGGFFSVDQLHEIYGLSDTTFGQIKPRLQVTGSLIRKIPINSASLEVLAQHPYLRYKLARPVTDFRREHGPFASVEDLQKVMAITESDFRKLAPYLKIE